MAKTKKSTGITIKKPVSFLHQEAKIDLKKAFVSLSTALVSAQASDIKGCLKSFFALTTSIGIKENPEYAAWKLILNGYLRALEDALDEFQDFFQLEEGLKIDHNKLADMLVHNLDALEISIDLDFFEDPSGLVFVDEMGPSLKFWLEDYKLSNNQLDTIVARVKQRFALGLHYEWREHSSHYQIISSSLDSPFLNSSEQEKNWSQYKTWLVDQTKKRMFNEDFGLDTVFVPLRAYYKTKNDENPETDIEFRETTKSKKVVLLENEILNWVGKYDPDDCIKILSGGPGSGKSSCAKMLARKICETYPEYPVVFVPLHQFDVTSDLVAAMKTFIEGDKFLTENPLSPSNKLVRMVVIFDGLDEISMQGRAAEDAAKEFVDLVINTSTRQSGQGLKRQYLITGREIAVQSGAKLLKKEGQILELLPYLIKETKEFIGDEKLINEDQRNIWWKKYGKAKGRPFKKLPDELSRESLEELTKEPLLNYLVALSFERDEIDFGDEQILNVIYDDMLNAVYQRQYENRKHDGTGNLEIKEFRRVLEEIALSAWHNNTRVTSVKNIEEYCERSGISNHLNCFTENAKSGVSSLLASFYFRKSGNSINTQESFEFTHKSFGEFLTAKRIVRLIELIAKERSRNNSDPDIGLKPNEALNKWVQLCGNTSLDQYLKGFVERELFRCTDDTLKQIHIVFSDLLSHVLDRGSSIQSLETHNFNEILRQVRNSNETLSVIRSIVAGLVEKNTDLSGIKGESFGDWLKLTQGQRSGPFNKIIMSSLNHLNISDARLDMADLYAANLQYSDLSNARLYRANMGQAQLGHAILVGCRLDGASLSGVRAFNANFDRAKLKKATADHADFSNSSLVKTDFTDSSLWRSGFIGADLQKAIFKRADLRNTDFTGANLANANFEEADIRNAIFAGANMANVDLSKAKNRRYAKKLESAKNYKS